MNEVDDQSITTHDILNKNNAGWMKNSTALREKTQ